jgi:hypothetical protein
VVNAQRTMFYDDTIDNIPGCPSLGANQHGAHNDNMKQGIKVQECPGKINDEEGKAANEDDA